MDENKNKIMNIEDEELICNELSKLLENNNYNGKATSKLKERIQYSSNYGYQY